MGYRDDLRNIEDVLDEAPCLCRCGCPNGCDRCDECDGSGTYYIDGQPQACICSEPQADDAKGGAA